MYIDIILLRLQECTGYTTFFGGPVVCSVDLLSSHS